MGDSRTIRIAPSVLDADLGLLAEQIALVEDAGADLLHLDIMDGHFVPNLSIGVPVVAGIARHTDTFPRRPPDDLRAGPLRPGLR